MEYNGILPLGVGSENRARQCRISDLTPCAASPKPFLSEGVTFLRHDPGSKTIDAYKVRNEQVRNERARGIPHPTIFLVDNKGVIAMKLREESYRDRPTVEEILAAAKGMD